MAKFNIATGSTEPRRQQPHRTTKHAYSYTENKCSRLFDHYSGTIHSLRDIIFQPNKHLNRLYKWNRNTPVESGVLTWGANTYTETYLLSIRATLIDELFLPHLELRESTIRGAGVGVFAAQDFYRDDLIGYYSGNRCARSRKNSNYQFMDCDSGGGIGHPLSLAMHFMNDPTLHLTGDAREKATKRVNVHINADYGCRVIVPFIPAGAELFTQYEPSNAVTDTSTK
jgi:hypothetical protein